jgi:4-carboxymuconolactone decarboxylase
MDTRELNDRGLELRKKMFGDEAVAKRMSAFGDFGAPLQNIINAYAYGDVWSGGELPLGIKSDQRVGRWRASLVGRNAPLRHSVVPSGCSSRARGTLISVLPKVPVSDRWRLP